MTNVKDELKNFEENGYKITQQRKTRIFDNGSTEDGEWETISKIEIPKPVEQGRKILKIITENKTEIQKR